MQHVSCDVTAFLYNVWALIRIYNYVHVCARGRAYRVCRTAPNAGMCVWAELELFVRKFDYCNQCSSIVLTKNLNALTIVFEVT